MSTNRTQLEAMPKEIVLRMLYNQILQGNRPEINIFIKQVDSCASAGGFDWQESTEGFKIWNDILLNLDYGSYFDIYGKKDKN